MRKQILFRLRPRPIPCPPSDAWECTEDEPDGTYDDFWGECYTHRKWVACIDEQKLKQLIDDQILDWCGCDTLGSLGAPTPDGISLGCMPAICFRCYDEDAEQCAYITPYVCRPDRSPLRQKMSGERDWDRINQAFIARYAERYRHRDGPYTKARNTRLKRESQAAAAGRVFPDRG